MSDYPGRCPRLALIPLLFLAFPAFAQSSNRYALILADPPVAQRFTARSGIESGAAGVYRSTIAGRQAALKRELASRNIPVAGSVSTLSNAVFVVSNAARVDELRALPGVIGVVPMRRMKRHLNAATKVVNAPAAWTALGGNTNAGKGVKIGIIDTGIDYAHPAFQDPSLPMPPGFPKCTTGHPEDCAYTSNKVIVARSYVRQIAAGTSANPGDVAQDSIPDDYTPRDHVGHGTAVASCAAGNENTGGTVTFQGVAPKAYLGAYKIEGAVNGATEDAVISALNDAFDDGMDVVNFSLGVFATSGALETGSACGQAAGVPCDLLAYTFETAAQKGMVITVSAGNDGYIADSYPALGVISSPASAPSVLSVGATLNSHVLQPTVSVADGPAALQNIPATSSDAWLYGPYGATSAPLVDVTTLGNDGYACSALPAGSLTGAIALIQRSPAGGGCSFADKAANAAAAKAFGVIFYDYPASTNAPHVIQILDSSDTPTLFGPVVLLSNPNGVALKTYLASNPALKIVVDPNGMEQDIAAYSQAFSFTPTLAANQLAGYSSPGPNVDLGIKPDLVAVGGSDSGLWVDLNDYYLSVPAGLFMATQKLDPAGDMYSSTGYVAANGTSFASPITAGAAALVKQKNPGFQGHQIRSALVGAAAPDVTTDDAALGTTTAVDVRSIGAGRLDAGAAIAARVTTEPVSLSFGALDRLTGLPSRNLTVYNPGASAVTLSVAAAATTAVSGISVTVDKASITLPAGAKDIVKVSLTGTIPAAGSYAGAVTITGTGISVRVPYLFLVGDGVIANAVPIVQGQATYGFEGPAGTDIGPLGVKAIDQFGVPVTAAPVTFTVSPRGSLTLSTASGAPACSPSATNSTVTSITCPTDGHGIAWAEIVLGAAGSRPSIRVRAGSIAFTMGGTDNSTVLADPAIAGGGVSDSAAGRGSVAPGSYISIYGTSLVNPDALSSSTGDVATTTTLPMALDGVSVSFDIPGTYKGKPADYAGIPGRLFYVSPTQVNAWVPWELEGQSSVQMKVSVDGMVFSNVVTVPLVSYSPALFEAAGIVAALRVDGSGKASIITPTNPARAGDVLELYGNGFGPVENQPESGAPAPSGPLAKTRTAPTVTIGNQPATVSYSGLAPGFAGLYQLNVPLPSGLTSGNQPVKVSIGGQSSKESLVPVQ